MDVTDRAQAQAMIQAAEDRFSGIDVLINTAGYGTAFADVALGHMQKTGTYDKIFGGTTEVARGIQGALAGDPLKATAGIENTLASETTPFALFLAMMP